MSERLTDQVHDKFFIEIDIPECACELRYKIARCAITPTSLYRGSDDIEHFICRNCYALMLRVAHRLEKMHRTERPET